MTSKNSVYFDARSQIGVLKNSGDVKSLYPSPEYIFMFFGKATRASTKYPIQNNCCLTTSFSVGFSTLECLYMSCLGMHLSSFQLPLLWIGCVVLESDLYWSLEVTDPKHSPFQCKLQKLLFYCNYSIFLFLFYSVSLFLSKPEWKTTEYFNVLESYPVHEEGESVI